MRSCLPHKDYKLETNIDRIKYGREGASVQRCHTVPYVGSYDVGQHSFNMLLMLRILYPEAPVQLIWAIVAHDLPERHSGDIPAPTKWAGIVDAAKLKEFELNILTGTGYNHEPLDDVHGWWLKSLDSLELYLWTKDQIHMGNLHVRNIQDMILAFLYDNENNIPEKVWQLFMEAEEDSWNRIPELGK